jgi:hypothetical protein
MPGRFEPSASAGDAVRDELPTVDELLASVREFLHDEVMAATEGRLKFLSRVAGNSIDLVRRELALGPPHRQAELERLRALFECDDDLDDLRWRLVRDLRERRIALDDRALIAHLRLTVLNQLAIDQPGYAALKTAARTD